MSIDLAELHALGERIRSILTMSPLSEIEALMDTYLAGLDEHIGGVGARDLKSEQRQVLLQFKELLALVERERSQTETELLSLSKAGRATELYKKHAG
ncbi:hypothetical protein ACK3YJ_09875 [Aeromonas caviae]|jgi:hypothetical protein|uniref:Uncharacterized protein n=1 Tax=Aeromonas caviae TaxID=648 RepID=A0A7I8HY95_AERCA|nr:MULTISPECIES: hypothetical protein [Aeromonas]AUU20528.1 hypothetical protein MC60_000060 [Aeromonas caviae]KOG92407.1 hypothetical protein AL345_13350 [Aeromonas caviae]MCK2072759.1 hypothetical protein [Aeromonas caviae]MCX4051016.1 hypothetical protein [Aeromonas caviae]MCX4110443.1 hypothetical protein [Aeromonas caviae]